MEINDADLQNPFPPDQLIQIALAHIESKFKRDGPLSSPKHAADYFCLKLGLCEREVFAVLYLCSRNFVLGYEEIVHGTLNGATVYPREVLKSVLYRNASAVILVHNHPSGVPEPSQADLKITKKIKAALELVEVRVLDHIVVGGADYTSLSDKGLL